MLLLEMINTGGATATSATASDMAEVPLTPQMRATLAGGSGSILVGLLIPRS